MKYFTSILFLLLSQHVSAESCDLNPKFPKDLCATLKRIDKKYVATSRFGWSRTADERILVPSVTRPNGMLCYDLSTGGQPKNPDLCRESQPTQCEWGENLAGDIRCYENFQGNMVGGGPINEYLCRKPKLCTRENLKAEDHFW